mgnify:CR=1 FL=1|jgi:hypothetical protein
MDRARWPEGMISYRQSSDRLISAAPFSYTGRARYLPFAPYTGGRLAVAAGLRAGRFCPMPAVVAL